MDLTKIVATGLIAVGALGLVYGGFTYTQQTHEANIGALSVSVADKDRFTIPSWLSVAAILAGGVLLLRDKKFFQ